MVGHFFLVRLKNVLTLLSPVQFSEYTINPTHVTKLLVVAAKGERQGWIRPYSTVSPQVLCAIWWMAFGEALKQVNTTLMSLSVAAGVLASDKEKIGVEGAKAFADSLKVLPGWLLRYV
eukprot:g26468.t1